MIDVNGVDVVDGNNPTPISAEILYPVLLIPIMEQLAIDRPCPQALVLVK